MDSLQNAKSLKIFKDFEVKGQGQGLEVQGQGIVNWSSKILEDYNTADFYPLLSCSSYCCSLSASDTITSVKWMS